MNKKGDLSLSITAIVVIVIAFVVLGLGLTLTRTIFKGAQEKLPEAFAVTQLEAEPTSENPITLQQTIEIGREQEKTMTIGFYNKGENTATKATFTITSCVRGGVEVETLPTVDSISQDVSPSSAKGYSVILKENGLTAGQYICTMAVCSDSTCSQTPYDTKQFFLKVVA
ncbi:hypothetical protein HYX12_02600 [Candidatus Woesearchaeota archaeon]|nr:hypothetical protein [Candidatus Woesearchaeota archaeon]